MGWLRSQKFLYVSPNDNHETKMNEFPQKSRETYNTSTGLVPVLFHEHWKSNVSLPFEVSSPSEHYFYDRVLNITAGKKCLWFRLLSICLTWAVKAKPR